MQLPHWANRFRTFLVGDGRGASLLFLALGLIALLCLFLARAGPATWWGDLLGWGANALVGVAVVNLVTRLSIWLEVTDKLTAGISEELRHMRSLIGLCEPRDAAARGLIDATTWHLRPLQFHEVLPHTTAFVACGQSLSILTRERGLAALRAFLRRPETRLVVVLADPDNGPIMALLDDLQRAKSGSSRADRIRETLDILKDEIRDAAAERRAEIRLLSTLPRFTAYVFDDRVVWTPYLHAPGNHPERLPLLTFADGPLADGLRRDIEHAIDNARPAA